MELILVKKISEPRDASRGSGGNIKKLTMRFWVSVLFTFVYVSLYSQGYADNWIISNQGGLNFNSGSPVLFTSSANETWPYRGNLACISDKNGNLQFYYTEGVIYSHNNMPMFNGQDVYYFQSARDLIRSIILPQNDSIYYLIHLHQHVLQPQNQGLYYSVINMNLNNGLGAVVQKNIAIYLTSPGMHISGNLSVNFNNVQNRNEIWFSVAQGNTVVHRMVTLDQNGFSLTPTIHSNILGGGWCWNVIENVMVSFHTQQGFSKVYIYDYNKISSTFSARTSFTINNMIILRDLALTSSGRYLYVMLQSNSNASFIHRYDIYQPDSNTIKSTMINLLTTQYPLSYPSVLRKIKLAKDDKLYISIQAVNQLNPFSIGVIDYPDSVLPNNFNPTAINVQNKRTALFPSFVQSWLKKPLFMVTNHCQDSVHFNFTYSSIVDSVYWDFGDPASGALNFSNSINPFHQYNNHGQYYVTVTYCWQGLCEIWGDTITVEPLPLVKLPNDTLVCGNPIFTLDVRQGFPANYFWNTGSTDSVLHITEDGVYTVTITTDCGEVTDSIKVSFYPTDYQLNLPDTVLFCEGEMATILANPDPMRLTAYLWSTGDTLTGIQTAWPGLYWLNAETPCYPLSDSTWVVQDFCETHIWIPNAFTPDGDGTNDFFQFFGVPEPVTISIFNRWGERVFYSNNYNPEVSGWDGTHRGQPLPAGVYTYLIEYKYINPNANQIDPRGSDRQIRGTVQIVR